MIVFGAMEAIVHVDRCDVLNDLPNNNIEHNEVNERERESVAVHQTLDGFV